VDQPHPLNDKSEEIMGKKNSKLSKEELEELITSTHCKLRRYTLSNVHVWFPSLLSVSSKDLNKW